MMMSLQQAGGASLRVGGRLLLILFRIHLIAVREWTQWTPHGNGRAMSTAP